MAPSSHKRLNKQPHQTNVLPDSRIPILIPYKYSIPWTYVKLTLAVTLHGGGAVVHQSKEPGYTETTVVIVLVFVFVIVIVVASPLWDRSYPIATPARSATARERSGIQSA